MNEDTENKSDFLAIDEFRLHKEWLRQPALYHEYADKLANARKRYDEESSNLDIVEAELSLDTRKSPEEYDLGEKPTEASIKNSILTQKEYKIAKAQVIKAKHRVDVLQAAVTALEHRKRALTMLVELHGQNYFADPKVSGGKSARDSMDEMTKKGALSRVIGARKREDRKSED